MFWGALSGFASCIAQAGGPPYQVYALAQNLPKMTYVGTTAIAFATLNWLKVGPYIALGQFSTAGFGTSLVLVPLAVATNLLGFWLVRRVSRGAVLQDHAAADVRHLVRTGARRRGRDAARLTSARPLANVPAGKRPMAKTPYDIDLDRNPANYQPLTPLGFLERAAAVFPAHTAIIHGPLRRTYAEFYARSRQLASALAKRGIKRGDTVSVMLANTPPMLEAHYGVPMTQGVLNTLNTRLDAAVIAFSLDHAAAKIVIVDREFSPVMKEALSLARQSRW